MMNKLPRIKSTFALLDVKSGRKALLKLSPDHNTKIPVTIEGYIAGPWGHDDGESMEFNVEVTSAVLGEPR